MINVYQNCCFIFNNKPNENYIKILRVDYSEYKLIAVKDKQVITVLNCVGIDEIVRHAMDAQISVFSNYVYLESCITKYVNALQL
jgi:hypothetical protein